MRRRRLPLLVLAMAAPISGRAAANPMRHSRQCLIVVASNWNSSTGVLRTFERVDQTASWKSRGREIPVVLGKNGLAWGRGLVKSEARSLPIKIEGDNRAPAGIFRLGQAFGYASADSARWVKLRYLPLTKKIEGIDDPQSRYYNQLVDRSKVSRVDWRSSEQMLRDDHLYEWGVLVEHNIPARPGAGSCIFLHVWKNSSSPTAGCTAMAEGELVRLLRWLDPAAQPVLVQMPSGEYERLQTRFHLPVLAEVSSLTDR